MRGHGGRRGKKTGLRRWRRYWIGDSKEQSRGVIMEKIRHVIYDHEPIMIQDFCVTGSQRGHIVTHNRCYRLSPAKEHVDNLFSPWEIEGKYLPSVAYLSSPKTGHFVSHKYRASVNLCILIGSSVLLTTSHRHPTGLQYLGWYHCMWPHSDMGSTKCSTDSRQ